jgi:hypothetical protein
MEFGQKYFCCNLQILLGTHFKARNIFAVNYRFYLAHASRPVPKTVAKKKWPS